MKIPVGRLVLAVAVVGSAIGGFGSGRAAAAANGAPVVNGGSVTVRYEDVYSIHFTASDPDGDPLALVSPPINEDWIGCDGGPAADFNCDYSSSRYYDPAPLPSTPFQRTISYSVSDGTSTTTGVWTVTVLPPPTMEIVGRPTVTEGGVAVLQLNLSVSSPDPMLVPAHIAVTSAATGAVISSSDLSIDVAGGATTTDLRLPIADDAIDEPTRYLTVSVDAVDAIPYRFVEGGNLVTVLDNDGVVSTDRTPPAVANHRNVIVERSGNRPAWVAFSPPQALDNVDGVLPAICNPTPMSAMPMGQTVVSCSATDSAGNTGSSTFRITVRRPTKDGTAKSVASDDRRCVVAGHLITVTAEGFTPGSDVTIQLQSSGLDVVFLQKVRADRDGRVRQTVTTPATTAGDADVVLVGTRGVDDFIRMLPVKVAHRHYHHRGRGAAEMWRDHDCD